MAYIKGSIYGVDTSGSATTITVAELPAHETDDLILVFLGKDDLAGGSWSITTATGYTQIENEQSNALSTAAFYKVATSSSETIPVGSQTDADELYMYVVVIGDVDTTTPIDTTASQVEGLGSASTHNLTTPGSTANNNTLNFYWHIVDTGNREPTQAPGLMTLPIPVPFNTVACSLSWTFQYSSGTVVNPDFKLTASETGHIINVVVNSSGTPVIPGHADFSNPCTDVLHPLRSSATTGPFGGGSVDPSTDLTGGVGPSSETFNYDAVAFNTAEGTYNVSVCAEAASAASGSANEVWGGVWNLSAGNANLSSKKMCIHIGTLSGLRLQSVDSVANGGFIFGIRTDDLNVATSNAYRLWNVGAVNSNPSPFYRPCVVIDPSDTTYQWGSDVGSETTPAADLTAVTGAFLAVNKNGTQQPRALYAEWHALNNVVVIGGDSTLPCNFQTVIDSLYAPRILTIVNQGGSSSTQLFAQQSIQIGNGTDATYFEQDSASLEFASTTSGLNLQYNVGANGVGIDLYGVSGDTIKITNTSISSGTTYDFTINSSSTSAATWDLSGLKIINATIVLRDVFTAASDIAFVNSTITTNNADLSGGCTFDNTPLTITAEAGLIDVYNCTFQNRDGAGEAAITITGNQTGAWSDPGITVSNNTYDIEYTGTTNFSIESAVSLSVNNSSSGVLTIVTPTADLTLNSSETGTLLQIFTTATQTVLDSTTGSSLVYTHSNETVDVVAQKAGFLPQRQTGLVLSGDVTVTFNLVADPVYDSGHGLTYTTDASWSRASNQLTVPSFGPSVRAVHSLMIDSFISETSLRNTAYNISMNGPNAMFLIDDAEGASDASIENMTAGGVRYVNTSGATTAEWIGIESIGTIPGSNTGEYTSDGAVTVTDARATGAFDQIVKVYGDASHGNFDNRSASDTILKYQINGYREARVNIQDTYGITALEPTHYIVAMEPAAIGAATGDPALTITITDHGATPVSWNGKDFSITITDNATPSSGEEILREINYNLSLDATYQGKDPFSWPEMVIEVVSGSTFETVRGYTEDAQPATLKGVRVVKNDGTTPHPDFVRFQADDGTYFTPDTVAQLSAPNVTSGRVQVYNNTGAAASAWAATTAYSLGDYVLRSTGKGTELGDGVFFVCTTAGTSGGSEPTWDVAADGNTTVDGTVTWTVRPVEFDNSTTAGAYSTSWTDGQHFASGDIIRFRWIDADELEIETTGVATASGTTTLLNTPVDDTVYDGYGIDGSTVTEYSADFPNVEVDVTDPDNVFYIDRFYAWWKYNLTTEAGIRNFFGGVTAVDTSNITINNSVVDIFFDNTKAVSARQGDNIVIQRADGAYPQVTTTSGGGGLGFYYTGIGYSTSSGSGLDTTERNKLLGLYDYDPTTDTLEGSVTYQQAQRLMLAEAAGKVAVSGSTVTFRDQADSKDRITATVDSSGQRTSVTTDSS